ncbi:MAG TPA: M56 family metallopeptidase, partial [Pirellulales bacterium]|nr:M56 family metallopeptidase [Pirellulales bacterium]
MPALLLAQLLRTTATLSVAALVVFLVLRGMRYRSARLNRAAWLVVLLSGWLFVRAAIVVPWYEPPPPSGRRVAVPAGFPIDMLQAGAAPAPVLNEISQLQPNAPAHAPPAGQRRFVLSWPVVGVAVWAIGIVTLIARWLIGYIRFVRRLPLGTPPPPEWRQQWQALLAERPVRRPIRLCITRDIGPLVCRAWGEYRLLAPESLWRELTAAQRAAILRHELAHVARGDLYKSLFVRVLALPHWFNPLAWWAVRHFDECGEWACDDAVRRRGPADAASYARVLLRLGDAAAHGYGAAVGGRRLSSRIQRLLMGPPWEDSTMKKSILVGAMVLLAFAGAVEWRLGFR